MRRLHFIILAFILFYSSCFSQDEMVIMRSGKVYGMYQTSSIDSILFYIPDSIENGAYYYVDEDNDGFGDSTKFLFIPQDYPAPYNYTVNREDCNDSDSTINPGESEICNDGKDNDCDGEEFQCECRPGEYESSICETGIRYRFCGSAGVWMAWGECTDTVYDIDGNAYLTVHIGNLTWMASNLRTTHYRSGKAIPFKSTVTDWQNFPDQKHCYYNNDSSNVETYGLLYSLYYILDEPLEEYEFVCPEGWRFADADDWEGLINTLGGSSVAGTELLKTETGYFNGVLNGFRHVTTDRNLGESAYYWSPSTEENLHTILFKNGDVSVIKGNPLNGSTDGCAIRCVRIE